MIRRSENKIAHTAVNEILMLAGVIVSQRNHDAGVVIHIFQSDEVAGGCVTLTVFVVDLDRYSKCQKDQPVGI